MKRTGIADSPLHGGKAPRWLFQRMTGLARQLIIAMVQEFGTHELLHRLSDPHWFQALGSVLGFDWHSSGLTTTACGARKERRAEKRFTAETLRSPQLNSSGFNGAGPG